MKSCPPPPGHRPSGLWDPAQSSIPGYVPFFDSWQLDTRYPAPPAGSEICYWFIFRGNEILVPVGNGMIQFQGIHRLFGLTPLVTLFIGMSGSVPCYAVALDHSAEPPQGFLFSDIRGLFGRASDEFLGVAARASHLLLFDRTTKFCGVCGAGNQMMETELAKQCPECGQITYPRLSPAIIVLVRRGDEVLLARSPHFPPGMYSLVAGFVEPGETIEHAVHREVMEETGISIGNLQYIGSQPWPFPDSLMIGFVASYAGGAIKPDKTEIEDAGWYKRGELPGLPGPLSLSRALIDLFEKDMLPG
jgi:NAD+ diphosphatase